MENVILTLNKIGEHFAAYSGSMLIQSGVLIVLLLVIDWLIRKRVRAVFRYCIWMLVFVKLLLPPSLCLPTGIGYWCGWEQAKTESTAPLAEQTNPLPEQAEVVTAVSEWAKPAETLIPQQPVEIQESAATNESAYAPPSQPEVLPVAAAPLSSLTWQAFVFLGWLVGVLVLSVVLIQRFLFVKSLVAQSELAEGAALETLERCRKQVGLNRPIQLRLTSNMLSPAACGLRNPVVLMPASLLDKLTEEKLNAVLIHELAHIKRGDLWVNFMQTLLQIVYFYNPLLWVANAMVRGIREKAVDEMVLTKLGNEANNYSNTLIDIAEIAFSRPHFSLRLVGVVESKKALTGRIKHILSRPFPKSAKIGLVGLAAIFLAAAVLLPMAKGEKEANPVPKGGLYENAKGSRNYKIKIGPTKFEVHTVVRYMRDGQPVIKNSDGSEKRIIDMETPDFSAQTKWMDIAQVYLSPEQTKYDVVELRAFNHNTRELLKPEDYPGIGYQIKDSVVTVYSTGKMLPDSLDIWMRVLHKPNDKEVYLVQPTVDSLVNIDGNTLRILDVAKGQYSWANGKRTKHHDGWDDSVTSVALKFDRRGNKQYQVCAIAKDGHRVVPDFPHFFRPSNGWIKFEVALPMDQIKHFELRPFEGRDRFFFDDVKLPPRSGRLDPVPPVRFTINGQGGTYQNQSNPLYDLSLHVLPNTDITGTESNAQGLGVTYRSKKSAETQTAIAVRMSGFCVNDKTFVVYDKDGNRLDISKGRGGGSVTGANSACYYIETKTPVEKIHAIDVYFREINDSEIPARINPGEAEGSELKTNNYTATLPNGVTVELLGICEHPSEGKQWWKPDGSVLESRPYEVFKHHAYPNTGELAREMAIQIWGDQELVNWASINWKIPNSSSGSGHIGDRDEQGQQILTTYGIAFTCDSGLDKLDFQLGIAAGPWKDQAFSNGAGFTNMSEGDVSVGFAPPMPVDGKTRITVSWKTVERDFRVVAIDKENQLHTATRSTGGRSGDLSSNTYTFEIPPEQIKTYKLQSRNFEWVTFKNVSLHPGGKTEVEIETQSSVSGPQSSGNLPNPVAYWSFDGNAKDKIGNNDGTVYGAVLAEGVTGQAYYFEGDGDCVSIPDSSIFDFGDGDFTISAWFRTNIDKAPFPFILNFRQDDNNPHIELYVSWNAGTHLFPGGARIEYPNVGVNDDKWHHMAVTLENGAKDGYKLYLDGLPVGQTTYTGILEDWDTITIGAQRKGGNDQHAFKGFIDEVAIYKQALSADEIKELYHSVKNAAALSGGEADAEK